MKKAIVTTLSIILILSICFSASAVEKTTEYCGYTAQILYEEIRKNLYFPESFTIRKAYVWPNEAEGVFVYIDYTAENRVGGKTPSEVYIIIKEDAENETFSYSLYSDKISCGNSTKVISKALDYISNQSSYQNRAKLMDIDQINTVIYMLDWMAEDGGWF